jgi:TolA-binding protein
MTVVEWLRFIQARSQVDQDWMQAVMTRVLLFRATPRIRPRAGDHNDRQLLLEFRSQSQRLQDEMTGDVERLQDQLTEADGEVDQVRGNLIALTRQVYDDREKYDLSMKTTDARIKSWSASWEPPMWRKFV